LEEENILPYKVKNVLKIKHNLTRVIICLLLFTLVITPLLSMFPVATVSAQPTNVLTAKWSRSGMGTNWEGGLVIGDVTGDGLEDIVYAGGGNDIIYVLNANTGATIATYSNGRISQYCQPQLYDVDGDGVLDILVPLYYEPGLAAVRYDGDSSLQTMWVANIQRVPGEPTPSGSVMAKPVAGDIDGDGDLDIFIASQDVSPIGGYDGTIVRLDHNGNEIARSFSWRACSGGLSLGDTDNDGVFEVYQGDREMGYRDGGYGKGVKSFWADNLTERWVRLDFLSSSQAPVLADVNGDGILDVLAGMYREMNILNSTNGEWINRISNNTLSVHYGFTVFDIDGDGRLEILCSDGDNDNDRYADVFDLVTGNRDAQLSLLDGDWKWSPVVADIDPTHPGMEIIVCPNGTTLETGYWRGAILVYSSQYELLQAISRFNGATIGSQLGYPVVQDIDNDNLLEVVTHSSSGTIYAFDTVAPRPAQRIRSEVTYFGEKRAGAAVYEPAPWAPNYWTAPLVAPVSPADNTISVPVSTSQLRFQIREHQSQAVSYTVTTSPNIGSLTGSISSGTYNWNTITVPVTNLAYDTTYKWTVTVSDGSEVTSRTYTFKTQLAPNAGNIAPTQATPTLAPLTGTDVTSTFQCSNQSTSDANNDDVTNIYRWTVNNAPVAQLLLPFDVRSDSSTTDYSGFGNNGVIKGANWVPNGQVGGAYSFDGKDDAIVISDGGVGYYNNRTYSAYPNHQELGGFGNWDSVTVETWLYLTENNYGSRIIGKIPSYSLGFQSSLTDPNRLTASVWPALYQISTDANQATTDRERSVSYSQSLQLNTWYHVAFTYRSGVGLRLYLNGELVSQTQAINGPLSNSRGEPLYIGQLVEPFAGMIDEVRIYNYALPQSQINNRYQETRFGESNQSLFTPQGIGAINDVLACQVIPTDSYIEGQTSTSSTITIGEPWVQQYTLTVNIDGGGSVTKNPNQATYDADTNVTLTAIANSGWTFSGWSGDLTGNTNPQTITMDANKVVTATFTELPSPGYLFEDGFESGTFNAWTSTSTTSGETATVVSGLAYADNYCAQFTTNAQGGYEKAYATLSLPTSIGEVYTQGYFRLAQNGLADNSDRIKLIELRAGSTIIAAAGVWQTGTTTYWWMETRNAASYVETHTAPANIDLSNWFSMELKWVNDDTAGGGSLWVNDNLIYQIDNADTDNYGDCTEIRMGLSEAYNCDMVTLFLDNVKVDQEYIGSSVQQYYNLTIQATGEGTTNPSPGTYQHVENSIVSVTANPDSGYIFSHWLLNNTNVGSTNPYNIEMDNNYVLTAVFSQTIGYLFEDDFELGTFERWSSTTTTTGESIAIASSPAYSGSYSAQFTSNGELSYERAYASRSGLSLSEVSAQAQVYVNQSGIADNGDRFYFLQILAGGNMVAYGGWRQNTNGNLYWHIMIRDGTTTIGTYSTNTPALNQWYTVELHWIADATNGLGELYVDGVLVCTITNSNTANFGNATMVRFGLPEIYNCDNTTVYLDNAAITESYINTLDTIQESSNNPSEKGSSSKIFSYPSDDIEEKNYKLKSKSNSKNK